MAYCTVRIPVDIVKDEVIEYRELVRALLSDIKLSKGISKHKYAKSLCYRIEFYDYPAVISQLEDILNA